MNWHYRFGKFLLALPVYIWVILFIILPFLFLIEMSLSLEALQAPWEWVEPYILVIRLSFQNFILFFSQYFYLSVILSSLKIATISTFWTAIMGYALAYAIATSPKRSRNIMIIFVALPLLISFLLRIYAWMGLFSTYGVINNILIKVGLITEPITFLGGFFAVSVGIIYCYLPFMILPIYIQLEKIDPSLLEAASDLGARPLNRFLYITLPLSFKGVIMGCLLVFSPVMGEFLIPELLGSSEILTMGRALFWEFFSQHNLTMTSAIAVVTIISLVLPSMLFQARNK